MTDYSYATEVAKIAAGLIKEHKEYEPLAEERIEYVFRDKHGNKNGKPVLGKARKISGLNAFLASIDDAPEIGIEVEEFFVMEIARDLWLVLTVEQKTALVEHELQHFFVDYDDKGVKVLQLLPHDLEEFAIIVKRHGLWQPDLRHFVKVAAGQLQLIDDEDPEDSDLREVVN